MMNLDAELGTTTSPITDGRELIRFRITTPEMPSQDSAMDPSQVYILKRHD